MHTGYTLCGLFIQSILQAQRDPHSFAAAHSAQAGVGLSPLPGSPAIERRTDGFADCAQVRERKASDKGPDLPL